MQKLGESKILGLASGLDWLVCGDEEWGMVINEVKEVDRSHSLKSLVCLAEEFRY